MKKILLTLLTMSAITLFAGEVRLTPPENVMVRQQNFGWEDSKYWNNWKEQPDHTFKQDVKIYTKNNKGVKYNFYLVEEGTNSVLYTKATIDHAEWIAIKKAAGTNTVAAEEQIMENWRESVNPQ